MEIQEPIQELVESTESVVIMYRARASIGSARCGSRSCEPGGTTPPDLHKSPQSARLGRLLVYGTGLAVGYKLTVKTDIVDLDPYLRGRSDFERGIPRHMNPYETSDYGTTLWESWFEGWDDAREDREGPKN
jgi:hypothetical protein